MSGKVDVAALRKALEESAFYSPRPWQLRMRDGRCDRVVDCDMGYIVDSEYTTDDDCTLIVSAVNALPALLDELEALRAVAEAARDVIHQDGDRDGDGACRSRYMHNGACDCPAGPVFDALAKYDALAAVEAVK